MKVALLLLVAASALFGPGGQFGEKPPDAQELTGEWPLSISPNEPRLPDA